MGSKSSTQANSNNGLHQQSIVGDDILQIPDICHAYNSKGSGCKTNACQNLHLCRHFVAGTCKFNPCKKSHDLLSNQTKAVLASRGFDVVSMSKKHTLDQLREQLHKTTNARQQKEQKISDCNAGKTCSESLNTDVDGLLKIPGFCHEYNSNKGDGCTIGTCRYLHLCRHFVVGTCKFDPCRKSHDLMSDQPKAVLVSCGFDIASLSKQQVLDKLRERLAAQRNPQQSNVDGYRSKRLDMELKQNTGDGGIGFCHEYNSNKGDGCTIGTCRYLHLCRHFVVGTCKFDPCRKSHDLMSDQPKAVLVSCGFDIASLSKQQVLDKLRERLAAQRNPQGNNVDVYKSKKLDMELKQNTGDDGIARQAVVEICSKYNYKDGCNVDECRKLHLCRHFVEGTCKFDPCNKSHSFMLDRSRTILASSGFDVNALSERKILDQLKEQLRQQKQQQQKPKSNNDNVGNERIEPAVTGDGMSGIPGCCHEYNSKGSECTNNACPQLHLCWHYVSGTCKFNPCRKSHDVFSNQPKVLLTRCGFETASLSQNQILDQLREKIRRQTNTGQLKEQRSSKDNVGNGRSESSDKDADPKVCIYHLLGRCIYKNNDCFNYHSKSELPYQWQWNSSSDSEKGGNQIATGQWNDFCPTANVEVESKFCDVNEGHLKVQDDAIGGLVVVNFESMTFGGDMTSSGVVRRLGTDSVATSVKRNRFTTVWNWYCHQGQWEVFPGPTPTSPNTGIISSFELDLKYLANPLTRHQYHTSAVMGQGQGQRFLVDMKQMTRTELSTQEVVKVRRRPVLYQPFEKLVPDEASIKDQPSASSIRYPECWDLDLMKDHADDDYVRVPVSNSGKTADEYKKVCSLFAQTMPNINVKSVSRIQNRDLWESFDAFKTRMNRKRSTPVIPMSLFHGSKRQYIEAICQQGFDWRMCGTSVGTLWGKGSYFARDAKYSTSYTDCRATFIVQVLVGDYTVGHPTFVRPPPKDQSQPYQDLFDSVVNDVQCPSIFVSFERSQSYPEYLIEY